MQTKTEVLGVVSDGFERVAEVWSDEGDLDPGGGAFCAWVDGRPVVDLYSGLARSGQPWAPTTLAILMSSTKAFTALAVHLLIESGLLELEAPVKSVWPEFNDDRVLVRHVLAHSAGRPVLPRYETLLSLDGRRGWTDTEAISAALASATAEWEPGSMSGYHAITFGYLCGELIKRVDGRSLGGFVRNEVAAPLGADVWIGLPPSEHDRVATVIAPVPGEAPPEVEQMRALMLDPKTVAGRALFASNGESILTRIAEFMNQPSTYELEIGSSNGVATARGAARVFQAVARGGELDGVRIAQPETVARMGQLQSEAMDPVINVPVRWALGFMRRSEGVPGFPAVMGPQDEAFGHTGYGGQFVFADPVSRVSVAFVRSRLMLASPFGGRLVETLYECL